YNHLSPKEKIEKIAQLRNARLKFTNNLYNIDDSIYHCVIRDKGKFFIFEEETKKIDIHSIDDIKATKSSIAFNDGIYEYSFSLSKSTLMKRFETTSFKDSFEVEILEDPLEALYSLINQDKKIITTNRTQETIYLPLYGRGQKVYINSGLNQWNAKGRVRHPDEVYIPVPREFHKYNPNFFPDRDTIFTLRLPNGDEMEAKLCQENSKALMSNPNRALGKWLLRDVFELKEGELVTSDTLKLYGIDSVRIDKINDLEYEINFAKLDSYENFIDLCKN
ncbi:MAG: NgoFVII family restriction endonuclease, partial [Epsilonproteobacteria bacterium]|nr:NgoFVII family restriction endonuclease [Campylobacterota bacterium]